MIRFKKRTQIHSVECIPNLNLLGHAQLVELSVGSRCGGHGICGGDRLRIPLEQMSMFSAITDKEREHLSKEDLALGWRLGCQTYPDQSTLDIEIEVLDD